MADTSAIYLALAARLSGDAALMALMTDGVHRDVAPAGTTKVVILSKQADSREYGIDRLLALEDVTYLAKAVEKSTSGSNARQAASRIRVLLQDAALSVSGYGLMRCHVSEDNGVVEYQEVDPDDTD